MKTDAPIFKVGDRVSTAFNGRITNHTVTRVAPERGCQSGWLYWTDPPIGSSYGTDQAWLTKVELNKQTGGGCE